MPALRCDDELTLASALQQLFMHTLRVVQQYLIPADEYERRGQAVKLRKQRRDLRRAHVVGIALGVKAQELLRQGGVGVLVRNVRLT